MRRALLAFLLLVCFGCNSNTDIRWSENADVCRTEILLLHNKERIKQGIDQLEADSLLDERAQKHAEWMADRNSLTHSRLDISGTKFNTMGENIAMGFETTESVLDGWMHSSGHKRNILNKKFTHAGFGYAQKSTGRPYWCALFGGK